MSKHKKNTFDLDNQKQPKYKQKSNTINPQSTGKHKIREKGILSAQNTNRIRGKRNWKKQKDSSQ